MNILNKKLLALIIAFGAITTLTLMQADDDTEATTESTEVAVETPTETPAEPATETPSETPVETPTETPVETTEAPAETPVETPTETPVEPTPEPVVETPTETPTETPVEVTSETPTEPVVETSTEAVAETPATEAPAEATTTPEATTTETTVTEMTQTTEPTLVVTEVTETIPAVGIVTPAPQQNKIEIIAQPIVTQPVATTTVQVMQPIVLTSAEQDVYNRFLGKTLDQVLAATNQEIADMKAFSQNVPINDPTVVALIPLELTSIFKTIPSGTTSAALEKEQKNVEAITTNICLATYKDADKCKKLITTDREHVRAHTQFLVDMITLSKKFKADEYNKNKAIYDNAEQSFKNNIAMIDTLN